MAAPHPLSLTDLLRRKAELRVRARTIRDGLPPALGAAVAARVLALLRFSPGAAVAGFWPLPGEIDLRTLWGALHKQGQVVLLPETPPRGLPLVFRRWAPEGEMVAERFGTLRPVGPVAVPDMVFVPFLAFDRAGHRLGYGGGYYDRTLAALPGVPAIGVGFAALEVDSVPAGPHDHALDAVITEHGLAVDRRES
jgi:5-formyltetrahydrofolate cyclo-ligase